MAASSPIITRGMRALEAETVEELKIGLKPAPLAEWVAEEERFKTALAGYAMPVKADATHSSDAANIPGLRCSTNSASGRITFEGSEFENLSDATRIMRGPIFENPYTPAYTTLFADQESMFYRYFSVFQSQIYNAFKRHKKEGIDTDLLFDGRYDDEIHTFSTSLTKKDFERYMYLEPIFKALHRRNSNPLCVSAQYSHSNVIAHMLATVFWKKDGKYYGGFFDPLYYVRRTKSYVECLEGMYVLTKILFHHWHGANITLVNFSQFCLKEPVGKACLQYVMDAEYCSIYVAYFLYLYAKAGYPTEFVGRNTFAKVVHDTYIIDPIKLKRNVCKATNIFKLRFINFATNLMLRYTDNPHAIESAVDMYKSIEEGTGLQLAPPQLIEPARRVIDALRAKKVAGSKHFVDDLLGGLVVAPSPRKKTSTSKRSGSTKPRSTGGGYRTRRTRRIRRI